MKLLVFAIDGTGMGHIARTLALSRSLRALNPQAEIHFLVESPAFPMVARAGFPVIKVPDPRHLVGRYSLQGRRVDYERAVIAACVEELGPDAVLFDFLINREVFTCLRQADCKILVVLREMRERAMRQLGRDPASFLVDAWLVPHERDEFPIAAMPVAMRARCQFLGPIVRPLDTARIPAMRTRYAGEGRRLVVVTVGGGGSAEARRMVDTVRAILARLAGEIAGLTTVLVWGPLNPEPLPEAAGGVVAVRYEPDLPELLAAADLVISNAGYNTLGEAAAAGTPALILPLKTTGRDDQEARARECAAAGWAWIGDREPAALEGQLRRLLAGEGPPKRAPAILGDPTRAGRALARLLQA